MIVEAKPLNKLRNLVLDLFGHIWHARFHGKPEKLFHFPPLNGKDTFANYLFAMEIVPSACYFLYFFHCAMNFLVRPPGAWESLAKRKKGGQWKLPNMPFIIFIFFPCVCMFKNKTADDNLWLVLHNGCRSYWRDYDTALFILKHLYHDIPEDPDEIRQPNKAGSSENQRKPAGLICQTEAVIDEDLPLTFSDRTLIREFSRKVRKTMRIS